MKKKEDKNILLIVILLFVISCFKKEKKSTEKVNYQVLKEQSIVIEIIELDAEAHERLYDKKNKYEIIK